MVQRVDHIARRDSLPQYYLRGRTLVLIVILYPPLNVWEPAEVVIDYVLRGYQDRAAESIYIQFIGKRGKFFPTVHEIMLAP